MDNFITHLSEIQFFNRYVSEATVKNIISIMHWQLHAVKTLFLLNFVMVSFDKIYASKNVAIYVLYLCI